MCNCTKMASITGNEANDRLGLTGFSNFAGKDFTRGFGNYSGSAVIPAIQPVGITVAAPKFTAPSVSLPTQPAGTVNTAPDKKSVWDLASSAIGIFAKPKPATTQASPEDGQEPKGGVPKAVWVVLGVLVVLAVVYFVVKARKK